MWAAREVVFLVVALFIQGHSSTLLANRGVRHVDYARVLRVLGKDKLRALEKDTRCGKQYPGYPPVPSVGQPLSAPGVPFPGPQYTMQPGQPMPVQQQPGSYPYPPVQQPYAAQQPYTVPAQGAVMPPGGGYNSAAQGYAAGLAAGAAAAGGTTATAPVFGPDPGIQRCRELCGATDPDCASVCSQVKDLLCDGEFTPEAIYVSGSSRENDIVAAQAATAAAAAVKDAVAAAVKEANGLSEEASMSMRKTMREGVRGAAKATRKAASQVARAAATAAAQAASQTAVLHATQSASVAAAAAASANQASMTTSHTNSRNRKSESSGSASV